MQGLVETGPGWPQSCVTGSDSRRLFAFACRAVSEAVGPGPAASPRPASEVASGADAEAVSVPWRRLGGRRRPVAPLSGLGGTAGRRGWVRAGEPGWAEELQSGRTDPDPQSLPAFSPEPQGQERGQERRRNQRDRQQHGGPHRAGQWVSHSRRATTAARNASPSAAAISGRTLGRTEPEMPDPKTMTATMSVGTSEKKKAEEGRRSARSPSVTKASTPGGSAAVRE